MNTDSKPQGIEPTERSSSPFSSCPPISVRVSSCLLVVTLLCFRTDSSPATSSQPVAVVDFSVSEKDQTQWSWASGGIADLLQIELERLGVVTLDRDFIR